MSAPQNSVPRMPVGTQHYGKVASRVPPPELSYAMSGPSLPEHASTSWDGPYFSDEPTEKGHLCQVAQGMQRQIFDESRPLGMSSATVSSFQKFAAKGMPEQMDFMSTPNRSFCSFNETSRCSTVVSVGDYSTVGRHVQNPPLALEMPDQSNIVPGSTKFYPSSRADVAFHSTHDGPGHPASDDVMPPKFVRMERSQEASFFAGNKQSPQSSSVGETFDMSPRRHHRVVPPDNDAHAASSGRILERSTEDTEGNAPSGKSRTQSTDCEDIPTSKCDSVGVVGLQKGRSHLKSATATKGKDRNTTLKAQKKPSKKARVPCPEEGCTMTFVSNSERNRHVRTSRDHVLQGTFRCDFCGDLLSRNDSLKRHVDTLHKDGDKPRKGDDVEYDVESEDEWSEDEETFEDEG